MAEGSKLTGYPSIDRPWLKYYSEEAIRAELPQNTIYEYMLESNRDYPDDIAIRYFSRKITFRELFRHIDACARALTALGVQPGEIVTVALPSIPEALYIVYALNKLGAVANMIHPLAGQREIVDYLNEVHSRVAILFDGTYNIIRDAISRTNLQHAVVVTAGESLPAHIKPLYALKAGRLRLPGSPFMAWRRFIRDGRTTPIPVVKKDSGTLAIISHTGGTTGEPKGVMCSDDSCNALMYQIVCNFQHGRQGRCMSVLPPFVNYSLIESMLAMLVIGYEVTLIPQYIPRQFATYIKKYHPNIILSIPAYWEAILSIEALNSMDLSCLEQVYTGGEAMAEETEQAVNALLLSRGAKYGLLKGLGSTELTGGATQTYANCNVPGSVGVPLVKMNCMTVEPDTTTELKIGETGEICFSGPTVMLGYYNNSEATDAIIKVHADGQRWLHTGDLGYIDADGVVFVTGRIKRIIMTKGTDGQVTKLFPDRIEKAISAHPAVELCCVVGVPDSARIHVPKAYVVLKSSAEPSAQTRESILDACWKSLPGYMVPETIEFCPDLPRTERGKIDFRALEKLAAEK